MLVCRRIDMVVIVIVDEECYCFEGPCVVLTKMKVARKESPFWKRKTMTMIGEASYCVGSWSLGNMMQ